MRLAACLACPRAGRLRLARRPAARRAASRHLGALRAGRSCRRGSRARTPTSPRTSSTSPSQLENGEKLAHLLRYETPVRVYLRSPELGAYRPDLDRAPRPAARRGRDRHRRDRRPRRRRRSSSRRCRRRRSPRSSPPPPASSCRARPTGRASCAAAPDARVRWPEQATLGRGGDLPAARHHAAGRARLPARGDHPGARPGRRPLPPARLDLERRQFPRHGDALRHDDPARALPAGAPQRHDPGRGGGGAAEGAGAGQPAGAGPAARRRARPSRGPGPRRSRRRSTATRRAARRLEAATLAAQIAAEMRPVDHRLGVSLLTLGRLTLRRDPETAAKNFTEAYTLFRREFGDDDVRTAQAGVHLAALALGTGPVRHRDPPRRPPRRRRRSTGRTPSSSPASCRSRPRRSRRRARPRRRRRRASTACAGPAMASATPTAPSRASRRSSRR